MGADVDLQLVLGEVLVHDVLDLLQEVLVRVGQLVALVVVGDVDFVGRLEFRDVDGFDELACLHCEYHVAVPLGVVALLDVDHIELHAHSLHQGDQPQGDALLAGRFGHIGATLDLHLFGVAQGGEDRHQALQHQGAAGG